MGHGPCQTFIESCPQGVLQTERVVIQPESSGCRATGKFSLLLDVHDLLTYNDLISILICIMINIMNRVRKYKHFKGRFVVL